MARPGFCWAQSVARRRLPAVHRVVEAIERARGETGLLPDGCRAVVAVSGGLDSVVLARVLAHMRPVHGWALVLAHFHHQLRGADADADQASVEGLGRELGLPVDCGRAAVAEERLQGESLETAARRLRHAFLAAAARRFQSTWVATAHHADDQVELFLLRLLRGAGAGGLGGMPPVAPSPADPGVQLARPLLTVTRATLHACALAQGCSWREDASNADPAFARNRVRHQLLPWLREAFSPGVDAVLERTQEMQRDLADAMEWAAHDWLESGSGRHPFTSLPVGLQREVLRAQFVELGAEARFDWIEAVRTEVGRPVTLAPGRFLARDAAGRLRWVAAPVHATEFLEEERWVSLEGAVGEVTWGGGSLRWQRGAEAWAAVPREGTGRVECLDADRVGAGFRLRHWRPGDRFAPLGLPAGARPKLQDLFINAGVAADERRRRVLAEAAGGEIFWVEGLRLGSAASCASGTRNYLLWQWQRAPAATQA